MTYISELAPMGKLRVGINFGNALLTNKDDRGTPGGIAVDLAHELTRRVGLPMELVSYDTAGHMADGAKAGAWDVAFLAADPARAEEITFTAPYLEIDTTCLVPAGSPLQTLADVDREGVRIAVSDKSAYDLFLTRNLKHAQLVRAPGVNASVDVFFADKLEALAGLKPLLMEVAASQPGTRVLDGRFSAVQQAVGIPKGRDAAAEYVRRFVEDIKASGLVADIIERNAIRGVSVAPPATA
ncbi:MAG: ABC transporter substrate-binding protein [Acidobacteria bacterium]|nr:MAG: ABC transporter substrate-binding protein [Acidobacteriota bacterium]